MYLGENLDVHDKLVKVNAMEPTGNGKFQCPTKEDIHHYPKVTIVKKKLDLQCLLIWEEADFISMSKKILKIVSLNMFLKNLSFPRFVIIPHPNKNLKNIYTYSTF